uniref:C3H1-type domain-containing protein n=1 Tax=Strongyloides stercoralis TaxID=6248 RepID=A0A0K0DSF1_STRER
MIVNLEEGELTPSPTEKEPPSLTMRPPFPGTTTHLDDDPEIARLFQEALHTLPDPKNSKEMSHRSNGHIAHIPSVQVQKKRKHQKDPSQEEGYSNKITTTRRRKRDSSAYSNSVDSRGITKRYKSGSPKAGNNRILKKPLPPKMSSTLAAEVSRYFNTSKRMQYLFDSSSLTCVEGTGTFNAEEIFEMVWEMSINQLPKLDKKCKELHLEAIIAENMVQEQITIEKRYKKELNDVQGKCMKNVNYTDISSGNLRLPAKLNEAMMKHDCCMKVLDELKEQYTMKFNMYQIVAGTFKKFSIFHKHLLEYKKLHDKFLMELNVYNQSTNDYNNKHNDRNIFFDDEAKSFDCHPTTDLSEHSSDMSLCSRNSPFCPPPSPPMFNQENDSLHERVNTLTSSSYGHENRMNFSSNSPISNNNRSPTSTDKEKEKDFMAIERNLSYENVNFNTSQPINNSIEEIPRIDSPIHSTPVSNFKDGNSLLSRTGSWANMQTYTKINESMDETRKRQLSYPLPITGNFSNNLFPSPISNGGLFTPLPNNNHFESQRSLLLRDKENGMTSTMASRYNSSIEDIDKLLCYYDLYGHCKDVKCKSLHGIHKKVLMDCIDYCIRSEDIYDSLPKPSNETLAYFVFTVLKENNYNYHETVNRLHNFVNNGYK